MTTTTGTATELDGRCIATIRTLCIDAIQAANSGTPTPRWHGARHLHPLATLPALRPRRPDLAQPRPVRALRGSCVGPAVVDAPPDASASGRPRLRGAWTPRGRARRPQALPPARLEGPRASRVPVDQRRRGDHRPAWDPGAATSVGDGGRRPMAAARYNVGGFTMFDFNVYAQAGDGCMMEGISSEAASFAAPSGPVEPVLDLRLATALTIEGHTDITFTEDVAARFTGVRVERGHRRRRERPGC